LSLQEHLSVLTDPRRGQGLRTSLDQLLIMSILSYLCGHTGYRGIARFCKAHAVLLVDQLGLRHGVPSHVTFRAVLMNIDSQELIRCFHCWASELLTDQEGQWFSGDGKALCSTVTEGHGKGQNFQAVVSLFAHQSGLVRAIGQYENKSKESGEQDILRLLLGELEQMGAVICLDALHCQKNG
jgi:hypothetical protein